MNLTETAEVVYHRKAELETLTQDILSQAKKAGADQAEVAINIDTGFAVNVRMGEVESIEYNRERGLSITVYFGKRMGTVAVSDLSKESVRTALEKACNIARYTHEDPYSGLADPHLLAYDYPNLDLYHVWMIQPEQAIDLAVHCENVARAFDKRIVNSDGASVNTSEHFHTYGNSHGFFGSYPSTYHNISCSLIGSDGHEMQRDYEYTSARDPNDLMPVVDLAHQAAEKTVKRLSARSLSTRQAPVIFAANVARELLGNFLSAISGRNIYNKSSFLIDHLQKPVFPSHICIDERPHILKGMGSAAFDAEGVKTRAQDFITAGELQSYILSSYSARKLGMQSTGNAGGVHNLYISTSDYDLQELMKQIGTGLLVTELIGQGVNIITGDYSRGAFGYWIENGEIQYPVHEITIAGNLKDMFANLIAVGKDVDHRGNIHTGPILIENMVIAGQ